MAKGQKKGNREVRKPKSEKSAAPAAVTVSTLMAKSTQSPSSKKKG